MAKHCFAGRLCVCLDQAASKENDWRVIACYSHRCLYGSQSSKEQMFSSQKILCDKDAVSLSQTTSLFSNRSRSANADNLLLVFSVYNTIIAISRSTMT